jgi:hypothetical protein
VQKTAGPVWLFERRRIGLLPRLREPPRNEPMFCQGWYADTGSGRYMSETHAPFWIYGSGKLAVRFAPSSLPRRIAVDGRAALDLRKPGWHLVTVDVPRLVRVEGQRRRVGLKLVRLATSP